MATAMRLKAIAKARDLTIEELLRVEIETAGSMIRASAVLGVSPNTIKYNLNANGLRVIQVTKVVKK